MQVGLHFSSKNFFRSKRIYKREEVKNALTLTRVNLKYYYNHARFREFGLDNFETSEQRDKEAGHG